MSWILDWCSSRIATVSMYLWSGGQQGIMQPQKSQFEPRECRTPIPYFLLIRCYYRWCGELMVQDKWQDRWEAWLGCIQWYLIIDYCSSWSPGAWGKYITIQKWGRSWMTSCCSVIYCETSSWLGWKLGLEERRVWAKIRELGGTQKRK